MDSRSLKRPKLEEVPCENGVEEEEQDLQSVINHHSSEVQHLKKQVAFYQSELEEAEKRLVAAQLNLRRRSSSLELQAGNSSAANGFSSGTSSRPQLIIPSVDHSSKALVLAKGSLLIRPTPKAGPSRFNAEDSRVASSSRPTVSLGSQTRHKMGQKEHQDFIPSISSCSSARLFNFETMTRIPSQHNRKMRCLESNPADDRVFLTSALNGTVNLWKLKDDGSKPSALLLSTINCETPAKKWPEDIVWHPNGEMLVCSYCADVGSPQVSTINLNAIGQERVTFLPGKPHVRGIISSIIFLHGIEGCFVTGGDDHAVVLWKGKNDVWKPKPLHQDQHSSAVKGVASLQHKKILLSVGLDKKKVGYDIVADRCLFKHQSSYQCISVLPNPCDVNLYMVQTSDHGRQLRLFDIRSREREIHSFGWKQNSESKSGLISQAWSHDGWHLSSGSLDPAIHLFDIRCNGKGPSQTVHAHQRRVFKAIWHQSIPLLTSVSSDHNIGLHKIE